MKTALDTPIKMMHIFRVAKVFLINQQKVGAPRSEPRDENASFAYQELGNLFNEDISMEEMDKLLQFEILLFKRVELDDKPVNQ